MTDINNRQIQISILGIFILIFGILIWFINTDFYIKKIYFDFKKIEFKTVLILKKDQNPVKKNEIYLKNGPELMVDRDLFDILEIGDSIIKNINSDSIFFYTGKGVIIKDYNKYNRNKYLETFK